MDLPVRRPAAVRLPPGPRLRAADVALAAGLAAAAVLWVAVTARHSAGADAGPLPARLAPSVGVDGPPPPFVVIERHETVQSVRLLLVNLIATAPVAVRRRLPYLAFAVAVGGVFAIRDGLLLPGFAGVLVCAYSAVAYGRRLVVALGLLLAAGAAAAVTFDESIPSMPGWLTPFAVLVPLGLAGATIRSTRGRAVAAARRADAVVRERDAATRAAIAEERARIARELYDVVSHHVSVMVIQAGGAGKILDSRPDLAAAALAAIETSGRDAMAELRHLLGLIAPLDDTLRPQPGLTDLDALVESVRAAGQPVTLDREAGAVPHGMELTVYRVVQEGLTNAMRHSPGARTGVRIHRDGATLVVAVRNEAPARPGGGLVPAADGSPRPGSGHAPPGGGAGLVGLRERVRLFEGALEARRRAGGGFELCARIPVDAQPGQAGPVDAPAGQGRPVQARPGDAGPVGATGVAG